MQSTQPLSRPRRTPSVLEPQCGGSAAAVVWWSDCEQWSVRAQGEATPVIAPPPQPLGPGNEHDLHQTAPLSTLHLFISCSLSVMVALCKVTRPAPPHPPAILIPPSHMITSKLAQFRVQIEMTLECLTNQ